MHKLQPKLHDEGGVFMNIDSETRILIVDDCVDMRVLVQELLSKGGFKNVSSAKDGFAALEILNQSYTTREAIEIILADWKMPGLSGIDLLKKIKEDKRFGGIIFIMLTAVSDSDNVSQAIARGVDNYLLKPVSSKSLISKIIKSSVAH